jgi:hypothetical protein
MLFSGTQLKYSYFPFWVNTESRPRKIASKQAGFSFLLSTVNHRAFLFSNHTHYKFVTESHNGPELLQICNNTYTGFSPGLQADHIQRPEETNTPQNKLEVLYNAADK